MMFAFRPFLLGCNHLYIAVLFTSSLKYMSDTSQELIPDAQLTKGMLFTPPKLKPLFWRWGTAPAKKNIKIYLKFLATPSLFHM